MGITAALNSLSFGSVSFVGGWLEGLSAGAPIYGALGLMAMSWLVFSFQKRLD